MGPQDPPAAPGHPHTPRCSRQAPTVPACPHVHVPTLTASWALLTRVKYQLGTHFSPAAPAALPAVPLHTSREQGLGSLCTQSEEQQAARASRPLGGGNVRTAPVCLCLAPSKCQINVTIITICQMLRALLDKKTARKAEKMGCVLLWEPQRAVAALEKGGDTRGSCAPLCPCFLPVPPSWPQGPLMHAPWGMRHREVCSEAAVLDGDPAVWEEASKGRRMPTV